MSDQTHAATASREAERLRALYEQNIKACADHQAGKQPSGHKLAAPMPSHALTAPTSAAGR